MILGAKGGDCVPAGSLTAVGYDRRLDDARRTPLPAGQSDFSLGCRFLSFLSRQVVETETQETASTDFSRGWSLEPQRGGADAAPRARMIILVGVVPGVRARRTATANGWVRSCDLVGGGKRRVPPTAPRRCEVSKRSGTRGRGVAQIVHVPRRALVGGRARCCGKKNSGGDGVGLRARQLLLRAATARNFRHPMRKCGFEVLARVHWRAQCGRRGARGGAGGCQRGVCGCGWAARRRRTRHILASRARPPLPVGHGPKVEPRRRHARFALHCATAGALRCRRIAARGPNSRNRLF